MPFLPTIGTVCQYQTIPSDTNIMPYIVSNQTVIGIVVRDPGTAGPGTYGCIIFEYPNTAAPDPKVQYTHWYLSEVKPAESNKPGRISALGT